MRKNGSPLTVLIVEDEPTIAALLEKKIDDEGHLPYVCGTVAGARLALGQGLAPDLALLDLFLPDERGDTLIDEVRKTGSIIVAMSANEAALERVRPRVDHAFAKPFRLDELHSLLR